MLPKVEFNLYQELQIKIIPLKQTFIKLLVEIIT